MGDIDTTQNPVQPQTETYPPGSAIPIDSVTGQPIPPGESNQYETSPPPPEPPHPDAPEPLAEEEEQEKPKAKPLKKKVKAKKVTVKKEVKETVPKMYFHPKKTKAPRVHRLSKTGKPKMKGASIGKQKTSRRGMGRHAFRSGY